MSEFPYQAIGPGSLRTARRLFCNIDPAWGIDVRLTVNFDLLSLFGRTICRGSGQTWGLGQTWGRTWVRTSHHQNTEGRRMSGACLGHVWTHVHTDVTGFFLLFHFFSDENLDPMSAQMPGICSETCRPGQNVSDDDPLA
jgi:hypothetical protein